MLAMLAHNLNRGIENVRLFESGNVFEAAGSGHRERKQLCVGATGNAIAAGVHEPSRAYSFFDLKGTVEKLLSAFEHDNLYFDTHASDYYQPGRAARAVMDGATVAQLGQLSAEVARARKLKQEIYVAEIFLDRLYKHALREARYQPLSKYPVVERDFSFVFPAEVSYEQIRGAIAGLKIAEIVSIFPADVLRAGKTAEAAGVAAGKYSLLVRVSFQSPERTLRDDEVAGWAQQIIGALEKLGGTLRS
jgi:phenylalanyl-tRNA synthetase beta chain